MLNEKVHELVTQKATVLSVLSSGGYIEAICLRMADGRLVTIKAVQTPYEHDEPMPILEVEIE